MVKILSQAGDSLADLYDVEGSVAGIDHLETHELPIVHEMGATVFSERLDGTIRRATTGAIAQNIGFDLVLTDLPDGHWRVLGAAIIVDVTGRINNANICLRDADAGREIPLYVWHTTNDVESQIRIVENGAAVAAMHLLVPNPLQTPNLGIGVGARQTVNEITFRGLTTGFGAGTVTASALIYIGFTHRAEISSRGVPLPGW